MSFSINRINIGKGINLNLINSGKFKSNLISIYIIMPLNRKEATMNSLIPLVLKRGTSKRKTKLDIERRLEELYGSNLSVNINKRGERHVLRFTIQSPKGVLLKDKDYFMEIVSILGEIIFHPYKEDGAFSHKYVEQEKEILKKTIEGKINDKREYAINRCVEEMCKNEKYGIYQFGYVEDLEFINEIKLYSRYRRIIESSPMEIFFVGECEDINIDKIKDIFTTDRKEIVDIPREKVTGNIQIKNMVFEVMDVSQGKLAIGYRSNIAYEDKLYVPLLISSSILGGGPNGLLFRTVRERESLAYYISSKVYMYKSIMLIDAGIDRGNLEKTLDLVRSGVDDMKNGRFSIEDINVSKKSTINSFKSIVDSNYLLGEYYLSKVLTGEKKSLEEDIEDIEKVKKEEIISASNSLNVDTIYFLGSKN